jgi:permuted papain-like amidase YaeF/Yiix C92 family enzyme
MDLQQSWKWPDSCIGAGEQRSPTGRMTPETGSGHSEVTVMRQRILASVGRAISSYLNEPVRRYRPLTTSAPNTLRPTLRPGDVLLVEGNTRVSAAIKYLTQSTWSHSALYVGDAVGQFDDDGEPLSLIEADMVGGVWAVPLGKYAAFHTRICRPIALTPEDSERVAQYAISRLGHSYDMKNMVDLLRYLMPMPPLPSRWRRRMLALGSGDPTKAICSTLIAQAFQSVGYPILPAMRRRRSDPGAEEHNREILYIKHYSVYTPRDFDISPYFQVVKPTIERGFSYRSVRSARAGGVRSAPVPHEDLETVLQPNDGDTEYVL